MLETGRVLTASLTVQLYPGACKSLLDFGHFVYANGTLKKFLLVQLYGEECGCCDKLHQA